MQDDHERRETTCARRGRRLSGAVLAVGFLLTGCSDSGSEDDDPVPTECEEVGSPDRVDGGDEDADSIDPGTGGIDDDDNTAGDATGDEGSC